MLLKNYFWIILLGLRRSLNALIAYIIPPTHKTKVHFILFTFVIEMSYIYIMKIKAKRDWMDIKTQRNFTKGGVYEVDEVYGNKIVGIGHAELVKEAKEEKPKKSKSKK